jgi:hypothetical protein
VADVNDGDGIQWPYAYVDGALRTPEKGLHGTCASERCGHPMVSVVGTEKTPHWRHKGDADHCADEPASETGPWHRSVQKAFVDRGARMEVPTPAADGRTTLTADVVTPDGVVIEVQTYELTPAILKLREATYGPRMAWIYSGPIAEISPYDNDPARFTWRMPKSILLDHTMGVFMDAHDGVWQLEWVNVTYPNGGSWPRWEGRRRRVARDVEDFADLIMGGGSLAPFQCQVQERKDAPRGMRRNAIVPDPDAWLESVQGHKFGGAFVPRETGPAPTVAPQTPDQHGHVGHERPEPVPHQVPSFMTDPAQVAAFRRGVELANNAWSAA